MQIQINVVGGAVAPPVELNEGFCVAAEGSRGLARDGNDSGACPHGHIFHFRRKVLNHERVIPFRQRKEIETDPRAIIIAARVFDESELIGVFVDLVRRGREVDNPTDATAVFGRGIVVTVHEVGEKGANDPRTLSSPCPFR